MDFNLLLREVLLPFIVGVLSSAFVVVIGIRSVKDFLVDRELSGEVGQLRAFWETPNTSFLIICGKEDAVSETEIEPRIGYSEAYGTTAIIELLRKIYGSSLRVRTRLVDRDEKLSIGDLDSNIVIFGSELSVSSFRAISESLSVPIFQFTLDERHRQFQRVRNGLQVEEFTTQADYQQGRLDYDFGSVVRVIDEKTRNLVVLLNGNHCAGLLAAAIVVTSPDEFARSGYLLGTHAQEVVVGVSVDASQFVTPYSPVDICRQWEAFSFDPMKMQRSLREA